MINDDRLEHVKHSKATGGFMDLESIVRPNIWALKPYRCARDDYKSGILLDANENSFGTCVSQDHISTQQLERYPDPHQSILKSLIASRYDNILVPENIFIGVGSDESIDLAIRVFCRPSIDKILICSPTYGMYRVSAQVNDVHVVDVPLVVKNHEFQLDMNAIMNALSSIQNIKICFLCSPGNPTGTLLNLQDIKTLLEFSDYKGMFLVDEAYIDFCPQDYSIATWVKTCPNLIVTQTLSKAFGLAGIRLGISFASLQLTAIFNNTKAPYNISTPTSLIAAEAYSIDGLKNMKINVDLIIQEREFLSKALIENSKIGKILGGNHANFILVQILDDNGKPCNDAAMKLYKNLAEKDGIVVRFRGHELGCFGCLRITIGTHEENMLLLKKISAY